MSSGRYDDRSVAENTNPLYKKYLKDSRGLKKIQQYFSPEFRYPNAAELYDLHTTSHIWKLGDRYYKLAHKHYGDPQMWWVIALYNQRPTEAHVSVGDVVFIPKPIEIVVQYFMTDD